MSVKVAINGFGRVGRLAFRQMFDREEFEIAAINDLTSAQMLRYLLKYDSSQGPYAKTVECGEDTLTVDGKQIKIYTEQDPKNLPWQALGIDVVLECTGFFASKEKSAAHIAAGAKRVLISAPAGDDLPTIVFGVNEGTLTRTDAVISAASCTTNALALVVNVLNRLVPIKKGYMTTIHAYTNDQNTLDAPQRKGNLRRARAAALNIVPTSSGAARTIGLVIPSLSGKLDGVSQRVPVSTGSLVDLVAVVEGTVTKEEIDAAMKRAATNFFGYTEEQIVSSDIIGMHYGSLYDATQTKVMEMGGETLVKVDAWYDNEYSYVSQMIRSMDYMTKL
ncbi:MAG: type I glyceraldehyde-3-phosphate dehydrogenase [Oscillospiraceae bacterium]|nr:type I glyceraldehyde-3-phosphate dehydrogenase [Oscillospiraceae bacterium]